MNQFALYPYLMEQSAKVLGEIADMIMIRYLFPTETLEHLPK